MKPVQQVSRLRKDGRLDEAYVLAREFISADPRDRYLAGIYGWCLIDLVKRHANAPGQAGRYIDELTAFDVPEADELLAAHRHRALSLSSAGGRAALEARTHGRDGRHEDAVRIYQQLWDKRELADGDRASFGWELSRAVRDILKGATDRELSNVPVGRAKQYLNQYFKLDLPRPDLLHSLVLQQALKLASARHLRIVPFLRLWNLDSLRNEDFDEFRPEDGKVIASLAERVIQLAAKEAAASGQRDDMAFVHPHLLTAMERFPENIWLKLNMVKLLRGRGQVEDARQLAVDFAKAKSREYWTWELLGDLAEESEVQLSCYAKALSCSQDEDFIGKVRLKFARLICASHPAEARAEVQRVVEHKGSQGQRIPPAAEELTHAAWFAANEAAVIDRRFYARLTARAEDMLFAGLPWIEASLGDRFVIEGKEGRKDRTRRRLYVKATPLPVEVSVPDPHADLKGLAEGAPLRVQMETSAADPSKTTVHRIARRDEGSNHDVVLERPALIDHVNHHKQLAHVLIARDLDGTFALSGCTEPLHAGQYVSVRAVRYHSRQGSRLRILAAQPATQAPDLGVCKPFREEVRVANGNGFTTSGIYIPRDLVEQAGVQDGDVVDGLAAINFNKKKGTWGWKAAMIK